MPDDGKRLSRPGKEDKRAAALRENLKKRKEQAASRKEEIKNAPNRQSDA